MDASATFRVMPIEFGKTLGSSSSAALVGCLKIMAPIFEHCLEITARCSFAKPKRKRAEHGPRSSSNFAANSKVVGVEMLPG
jgi:hypothetical protein